jgi:transposase
MPKLPYPPSGVNTPEAKAQREAFWRDMIRGWKVSGLSMTAFCKGEHLSDASLHYWIKEIRRRDEKGARTRSPAPKPVTPAKTSFVPVRVVGSTRKNAQPIEIVVGDHTLRVQAGFDPEALRQVVRVLEVRRC